MSGADPLQRDLGAGRSLRRFEERDADELYARIAADREHLSRWLPWAAGETLADTREFIRRSRAQAVANQGAQLAIVHEERIVGVVGVHGIDWANHATSIGYWLAQAAQGQGTMTAAVAALLEVAFGSWQLHRVEIRAGVQNDRSRAVPRRLGFTEEGILRHAERVGDRWIDLVVYSLLASEWEAADRRRHPPVRR